MANDKKVKLRKKVQQEEDDLKRPKLTGTKSNKDKNNKGE